MFQILIMLALLTGGPDRNPPPGCISVDGVIFCYNDCHERPDGTIVCGPGPQPEPETVPAQFKLRGR